VHISTEILLESSNSYQVHISTEILLESSYSYQVHISTEICICKDNTYVSVHKPFQL